MKYIPIISLIITFIGLIIAIIKCNSELRVLFIYIKKSIVKIKNRPIY
jgi:hypothetical protein